MRRCENCKYKFTKDGILFCVITLNMTKTDNFCEKFITKR